MLLYILTCGHYGAGNPEIAAGQAWEKVFGPWMVYLNSGGDPDALWNDAKKKAAAERRDWNYSQVTVPKDGKLVGTTWTISFNVTEPIEPGTAVLRFAFAGGQNAALRVTVNGREAGDSGRIGTDNAMARAGIHGQYSLLVGHPATAGRVCSLLAPCLQPKALSRGPSLLFRHPLRLWMLPSPAPFILWPR